MGVSAQQGRDRAAVAAQTAEDVGAGQQSQANQDLPPGIARQLEAGQTAPLGIQRTRSDALTASAEDTTGGDTVGDDTTTSDPVCLAYETVWSGFSSTQVCVLWSTP